MWRVRRMSETRLGLGIGWRPELALLCDRRADLGFVEITVENFADGTPLPLSLRRLQERGVAVIPHGISLSLGGAEPVDQTRIDRLARMAERCAAPLASEHIAFVRAGGVEIGHLTPIPRTRASVDAVVANVRRVRKTLGVPLALENIAALFEWPDAEMDESEFVRTILDESGALLLVDVSNLHANAHNLGADTAALVASLPLERIAYCHVGGGAERDGLYMDTHTDPVPPAAIALLRQLSVVARPPGAMLERDGNYPPDADTNRELDAIRGALEGHESVA
jgi:uncharacterized protein (UPF0276 family)